MKNKNATRIEWFKTLGGVCCLSGCIHSALFWGLIIYEKGFNADRFCYLIMAAIGIAYSFISLAGIINKDLDAAPSNKLNNES